MIQSFLDSWDLFGHTWMVGWCVAALLSLVGVVVVARNQIFVGAAVSQASTVGVAVGMVLTGLSLEAQDWLDNDLFYISLATFAAVAAAMLTGRISSGRQSQESLTGWVYLAAGSAAVLVIAHSAHGTEEIHRLLSSSILGASPTDLWLFGPMTAATALTLVLFRRVIVLYCIDPLTAASVGVPHWLGFAILGWLGLSVGLSIRVAGMLFAFGCLVLPALAARQVCREVRQLIWVTPLIAVGCSLLGFMVANHTDDPPAPMAVAFLCVVVPVARGLRRLTGGGT